MLPTLGVWLAHFEYHATRRFEPGEDEVLRPGSWERASLARSPVLLQCELPAVGEQLLEQARRRGGPQATVLVRVLQLLIAEEHRHARLLRAFARGAAGGALAGLPDSVRSRRGGTVASLIGVLRRIGGFESALAVLAAAELIGSVYYRALAQSTGCARLRALCRAILADELAHIGLLSELLAALRAGRSARGRALTGMAERLLLALLALVVWTAHRRLLGRSGWSWRRFRAACRAQYGLHLGPAPALAYLSARPARSHRRPSASLAGRRGPVPHW